MLLIILLIALSFVVDWVTLCNTWAILMKNSTFNYPLVINVASLNEGLTGY